MTHKYSRSLLISSQGIELVRKKLREIFQDNQELLSQNAQVSRPLINKFFTGKPVGIKNFQLICKTLQVNWQEVAELSKDEILPTPEEELNDILGRIIKGDTPTEVDKKILQNWLDGDRQVVSQLGKYAVNLGQAQDIHIGDRVYKDADAKLIRQIIRELQSFNQTEVHQQVNELVKKHISIQELRQNIGVYIQEQCGKMKVLDMEQPLDLSDIYISVNVLEKLTSHRRLEIEELLNDFDLKRFGQAGLGKVREPRVPGLEAAKRYTKLMVLGKPGAGKTTFLKHLAMQSCFGDFLADHLPIFITLKDFAETPKQPNLLDYICQILTQIHSDDVEVIDVFSKLLQDGKVLLLLDGLDEVTEKDSSRILRNIKNFVAEHSNDHYIITCRIAAQEYNFEQFIEVEVADFNSEQIKSFSDRWFKPKHPMKAEKFLAKVEESQNIRELAANPLLLTLLCLIFENQGKFKNSRSELYEEGIDLLLERWDDSRDIERDQIYRNLSPKRKKDLLSQIAFKTFTALPGSGWRLYNKVLLMGC
jgi:predicted NACHT family NTPase